MRVIFLIISMVIINLVTAQQSFNGDYRSMGMSGGYMFNIDDAAINTNPSLLGWQKDNFEHKISVSFADYWGASYSPIASFLVKDFFDRDINFVEEENFDLLDSYTLNFVTWDEMTYNYDNSDYLFIPNYDTLVRREGREGLKQSLMKNNSIKFNKTFLGVTYVSKNYGTFSFKVNAEVNINTKLSETLADLWAYGKTSIYFDSLVLYDGSHISNDPSNYQNNILDSIYSAFTNDSLKIYQIMDGSYFSLIQTRNYSVGWGNNYQSKNDDFKLYVGATVNMIEGLSYVQIINNDDEILMANFSRAKNTRAKFGNAGLGASIGFSGTAVYKDKWMISAGFNNLGFINWKYKDKDGSIGVFSDRNDNKEYANSDYGGSSTVTFQDQLSNANFDWREVSSNKGRASIFRATPANYHLGVRRQFGEIFSIGANLVSPLNKNSVGSMVNSVVSINSELTFKKFTIFSGVNNMNQTLSVPFGLSIGSRKSKWEIGLSIADLLGYFDESQDFNFSGGVGLKYRIK